MKWPLLLAGSLALACTGTIGPSPLGDGGPRGDAGWDAGFDAGADAGGWDGGWPDAGACPGPFDGAGETLATGLSYPRHLAIGGDRLFVSVVGVFNKPNGEIDTVYLDGGVDPLITGRSNPDAIAADGTSVYWADSTGLWKLGYDGGTPLLLDSSVNGALEGTTALGWSAGQLVYATGTRGLDLVKTNGSGSTRLFFGDAGTVVTSVQVEGTNAYFLVQGNTPGLYRAALTGRANPQQVLTEPTQGTSLFLTPTDYFWGTGGGGTGTVQRHPRAGGATVDVATGLNGPGAVLNLGQYTYFQDSTAGSPATPWFFQVATPCTSAPVPVGAIGQGVGDLVLSADGGTLYFTSLGGQGSGYVGVLP